MSDFNDKTLDEIKEHDIDNLQHVLKKSDQRELKDPEECRRFYLQTICEIANKHGANIKTMDYQVIHAQCLEKHIKIERRIEKPTYTCQACGEDLKIRLETHNINMCPWCATVHALKLKDPGDAWRSGTYIYKANEIVGWISEAMLICDRKTAGGLVIINDGKDAKYLMRVMRKA